MATMNLSSSEESSGRGGWGNDGVSFSVGSESSSSFMESTERDGGCDGNESIVEENKEVMFNGQWTFVYGGVIMEGAKEENKQVGALPIVAGYD